jgi:drug/metabolite transporter (DMT)-like permease
MWRLKRLISTLGTRAIALTVMLWPVIALAQDAPPQPSLRRSPAPWVGLLIIVVLAGIIIAVSLMPSKRGHQD